MNPIALQASLIEHFAQRRHLPLEQAARLWINRRAAKFRRWFERHVCCES